MSARPQNLNGTAYNTSQAVDFSAIGYSCLIPSEPHFRNVSSGDMIAVSPAVVTGHHQLIMPGVKMVRIGVLGLTLQPSCLLTALSPRSSMPPPFFTFLFVIIFCRAAVVCAGSSPVVVFLGA